MTTTAGVISPVDAAVDLARTLGASVSDTVVLRHGSNVSVLLRPAMLVAKVAWQRRGFRRTPDWFAREVAVAGHLRRAGVPAVRPATAIPPGPHRHRGHLVTFWDHITVTDDPVDPTTTGRCLRACHRALADHVWAHPPFDPCAECDRVLARTPSRQFLAGERALLESLAGPLFDVVRTWDRPAQALHGDPAPWNMLRSGADHVWCDFEDTYVGATWWDLACLTAPATVAQDRYFHDRAVAGYGVEPTDPTLAAFEAARVMHSAIWSAFVNNPGPSPTRLRRLAWLERRVGR
jgi:hypothetical protein